MNRSFTIAAAAAALVLTSERVDGQMYPVSRPNPTAWLSVGAGAFRADEVSDRGTGATWTFGNATTAQYRVSLEKAVRNQSAIGIVGTYVRAPIEYTSPTVATTDAHVHLYGLAATFHAGGGAGFHQVLDASAGVTSFQDFRRDSDGAELPPTDPSRDFTFTFGYGFGWGFSNRASVNLVQDYSMTFHKGVSGSGNSNSLRAYSTRLAIRWGLGGAVRRPGGRIR